MNILDEATCRRLEIAVMAAGDYLRDRASQMATVPDTRIGDDNPHTNLDLEVDDLLVVSLPAALGLDEPVAWVSEEKPVDDSRFLTRYAFIVDPIDGTRNVLRKRNEAAVSVALWENGVGVIWACVFNPFSCELFTATPGGGAFRNGEPIHVTTINDMKNALFLVSIHESVTGMLKAAESKLNVRQVGSIAYKMCLVAAGHGDATFTVNPRNDWDIAAGLLIVKEAGGAVTDSMGEVIVINKPSLVVNGVAVTNGLLHREVVEICHYVRGKLKAAKAAGV